MSFLSLGLENEEQQASPERNLSEDIRNDHDSDLSALALLQGQGKNAPATERLTAENNSGHVQVSTLRCAIKEKEVRNKISGNGDRSALGAVVSDCPPTFTTFKFGYLPGRGLLYSVIAHEIALCGLFLFVPYGLVTFRSQKLIIQMNSNDHLVYLPEIGGGKEGEKTPGGGPIARKEASAAPAHTSKGFAYPGRQAILSPQPATREWPQLPAELARKYAERQVVLYAIVDREGKISHVSVKQTPDPLVSDPIVQALTKWVFRPAQLNNQPVAVKVLLGIPL